MKMANLGVVILVSASVLAAVSAKATLYGDPVVERGYASDFPVLVGQTSPVLIVEPAVLPNGTLTSFET